MRFTLCFLGLSASISAFGAPICPPTRSVIAGPSALTKYLFKAATFGESDRKTAKDFAAEGKETEGEVEKRYAASGDLMCGTRFCQAQVVLKGDIIVTTAHSLYEDDTCDKPRDLAGCKFVLNEGGKRKEYKVESKVAQGRACPPSKSNRSANDWAILRLKKAVGPSVKPYQIGSVPCASNTEPVDVVTVGKSDDFGRVPGKKMEFAAKHYGRCQLKDSPCLRDTYFIESDCDNSPGSSGGGMFKGGTSPALFAITTGFWDECPDSPETKSGKYKPGCWSAVSAPLAGVFEDKLREAAGVK